MTASKADLWTTWLDNTLFEDIRDTSRPDPVPFLTAVDGELATTNALDRYRYGKNDGEYLYLLYLADEPINTASDITPVYVGESRNIGSRIYQHYKKSMKLSRLTTGKTTVRGEASRNTTTSRRFERRLTYSSMSGFWTSRRSVRVHTVWRPIVRS